MKICKCGLPLYKIRVATIPGNFDTKFVEIEICDNWLDQYHDETPSIYAEPVCAECGVPLRGEDVEAGETACLDCQTINY